jgi:hypothetical protein
MHQLTLIVDKNAPKNNPVAIDARHTWRPFVLNDAGLLHATFASWALYAILANGFSDLMVCKLKHKNEAIRIVNCKLATSGGNISDEVVGTVLTLANLEVRLPFGRTSSRTDVYTDGFRISLGRTMRHNFTPPR